MTPAQLIAAALDAAKLGGCNCQPDITIINEGGALHRAVIAHDRTCRLVLERGIGDRS